MQQRAAAAAGSGRVGAREAGRVPTSVACMQACHTGVCVCACVYARVTCHSLPSLSPPPPPRAGARLMTGKPLSALRDAETALAIDPRFVRAACRAATCHCR